MEFGERLKMALRYAGMTQSELAKESGITAVCMSRYIRGQRDPKMSTIIKMCRVLNCSADWLMGVR